MKKVLVLAVIAVVVIGMGMAGSAIAATAGTADVTINATVTQNCTAISAANLSLTIDPTTAFEVDSAGNNTKIQCTSGAPYSVNAASAGSGNNSSTGTLVGRLTAGGLGDIPYTLYFTSSFSGTGVGGAGNDVVLIFGAGNSVTSHGVVVAATDANDAELGSYADTVTLTVSY
jgi:spore coat protein U-like protein